ncbi:Otopetrin-3 [Armadillidium nasatum]|uniref:Otopetrin-3 n=1 Tax=Armadillidium nasatum TaxID=96803 RepID=A0A5N5TMG3_9CRUS|nr:Otopetrin-3 [Armadillidium nasatum]
MINDTTPYLYPFSIEYNILIVGIWILLWENIGRMDRHTHLPSVEMTYEDDNTKGISSNLIIYVDCHSSNRGLFAGLLMTVATIISIILFFIFTANDATKQHGLQVNGFSELIIHVIMIAVAILAFLAIKNLDLIKHGISNVDDLLLYICLPCIFLYAVFSMVPAFTYGKPLFVAVSIVQVVQAVIQTALIADGLRRCANSSNLAAKKPGRELITFLVVANVALWLLETFEIKSEEGNYYKYKFYGKETWTLLSHMTLPLALFYRFHSSVCLVDIWKAGYEAEAEH